MKIIFLGFFMTLSFGMYAQNFGYKPQNKKERDTEKTIQFQPNQSLDERSEMENNKVVPKHKKRKAILQFQKDAEAPKNYKQPYSNRRDKSRGDSKKSPN